MFDHKPMVVTDRNGKLIVVVPQIIFGSRRNVDWKKVEEYLYRYVGSIVEIMESKDVIYIGKDFADEYTGSIYTRRLRGGMVKAKANAVQGIKQIIEIAYDKRWSKNYKTKHKRNAEKGWYRYNTRFALPIADNNGQIIGFNIYSAVLLVRHAKDNKLYLYDILDIKKETSNPPWT